MTETRPPNFQPSWEEIHQDVKALAEKICIKKNWKGIVGVARGGLIPACLLSEELDIRMIETVCVISYSAQKQQKMRLLKSLDLPDGGRDWMIVDDLVDSGKTFEFLRALYPEADFVCLYAKPDGQTQTDVFVKEVPQNTWIDFPWEMVSDYSHLTGKKSTN